ncbi:MAG: hypothetical protein K2X94_04680 [Amoebophilaceae bacterium]|nr:hypothetical protein [Amoebophilaceae bacterium]
MVSLQVNYLYLNLFYVLLVSKKINYTFDYIKQLGTLLTEAKQENLAANEIKTIQDRLNISVKRLAEL